MLLILTMLGCKAVDPAPADLDGLLHWFWQKYEEGSDEELHDGVVNAFDIVDLDALADQVEDGSLTVLSDAETDLVGVDDRTAADAAGMYLLNVFQCDLPTLAPILSAADQDELYPGTYDSYQRSYRSSEADFLDGASDRLDWDLEYVASYLGDTYTANSVGGLRRVVELDAERSPHGDVLLQRTWMPQPAVWEGDNPSYDQDYQVEIYVDAGGGTVLHLYGMWRQAQYPGGFSTDNESVQRLLLNGLADWDDQTEAHCLDGGI